MVSGPGSDNAADIHLIKSKKLTPQQQRAVAPRTLPAVTSDPALQYLANKYGLDASYLATDSQQASLGLGWNSSSTRLQSGFPAPGADHGVPAGEQTVYMGRFDDIDPATGKPISRPLYVNANAAGSLIYGWSTTKLAAFQKALGLKVTGSPDGETVSAWGKAVDGAYHMQAARGKPFGPDDWIAMSITGDGTGGGKTTQQVVLSNRTDVEKYLTAVMEDKLGRAASPAEVGSMLGTIQAQERSNPTTQTVDAGGNQTISGGLDVQQAIEDAVKQKYKPDVDARTVGVDYYQAAMSMISNPVGG